MDPSLHPTLAEKTTDPRRVAMPLFSVRDSYNLVVLLPLILVAFATRMRNPPVFCVKNRLEGFRTWPFGDCENSVRAYVEVSEDSYPFFAGMITKHFEHSREAPIQCLSLRTARGVGMAQNRSAPPFANRLRRVTGLTHARVDQLGIVGRKSGSTQESEVAYGAGRCGPNGRYGGGGLRTTLFSLSYFIKGRHFCWSALFRSALQLRKHLALLLRQWKCSKTRGDRRYCMMCQ